MILNVAQHGSETKNIFHSRLFKLALNSFFLAFYLTEKRQICILHQKTLKTNCIKELSRQSLKNILKQTMRNSIYTQKKIISALRKFYKLNFYLNQQQSSLH